MCRFFDITFFQLLITTFIGVGLGIFTALWIDSIIKNNKFKKEKPLFLESLKLSLENNLSIINVIKTEFSDLNDTPPPYPLVFIKAI